MGCEAKSVSGQALEAAQVGEEYDKEDKDSLPEPETQLQAGTAFQVCRYLLDVLFVSVTLLYATIGLIDQDRLQLYHGLNLTSRRHLQR